MAVDNDIKVSICCLVYNHEPYLRQALDSMLMQKTNFKFEILIHDDASTDGSADIIREYEKKYPEIIKPVYQTKNQHSKGVKIQTCYNYPRIKGKYFAKCEGDDFWTDENKLQEQFDVMELNDNCSLCAHRVDFVNDKGEKIPGTMPVYDINEGITKSDEALKIMIKEHQVLFHTTSFFVRTDLLEEYIKGLDFMKAAPYGDYPSLLYYATKGDFYFIDKTMSVYRRGSKNSWSSTQCIKSIRIKTCNKLIDSMNKFNEYTNGKYSDWAEDYIHTMHYSIALAEHKYKKLVSKEYKNLFSKESKKKRLYTFLCWIFPPADWMYIRLKKSLHIKGF